MKLVKTIAIQLFTGANIATILLLWLCCGVTYLYPTADSKLHLLPLAFPAFLLANLLFVPFWLIFKIRRVWIPLAGIALCWSFVRDYCPVNLPSSPPDGALKVMTYNVWGFGRNDVIDSLGQNRMMTYLKESDADIICLQEAYGHAELAAKFQLEMQQMGYEYMKCKQDMIISRLHILNTEPLSSDDSSMGMCACLSYEGDSILLINVHLESDHLSPEVKDAYRLSIKNMKQEGLRHGLTPIARSLLTAAPVRAAQVDTLAAFISSHSHYPIILCGDFNDTPVSYPHRVLTRTLRSAFRHSGCGLGFSFHEHGFPIRIDNILYSPSYWNSSATSVLTDAKWSDHYPMVTYLSCVKKGGKRP